MLKKTKTKQPLIRSCDIERKQKKFKKRMLRKIVKYLKMNVARMDEVGYYNRKQKILLNIKKKMEVFDIFMEECFLFFKISK